MATTMMLRFELVSAATFGRGEGVAGLVDQEVEHDGYGLPYLRGRTLRGLLSEEMEGVLFALGEHGHPWIAVRNRLLGTAGRMTDETGILHVGDARLPDNLRRLIVATVAAGNNNRVTPDTVLESFTAIRRQTAMTPYGAPDAASLRAMRVIVRDTPFVAQLAFDDAPGERDLALLAAAVLAWRRAGIARNRGRGRLKAWLENEATTRQYFEVFRQEVSGP